MLLSNEDIKKIIPHRYPFLLVDKIESIDEETKTIVGIKCVSANEMQFLGHFPQQSVMPGVLIVEAMAQTGAVYLLKEEEIVERFLCLRESIRCVFRLWSYQGMY